MVACQLSFPDGPISATPPTDAAATATSTSQSRRRRCTSARYSIDIQPSMPMVSTGTAVRTTLRSTLHTRAPRRRGGAVGTGPYMGQLLLGGG